MNNEMQGYLKSAPKALQEYPFFHRFVAINNWPNVNYQQQIEEQPADNGGYAGYDDANYGNTEYNNDYSANNAGDGAERNDEGPKHQYETFI